MNTLNTNRIAYIDVIKFVAIFLVIWGHCIQDLFGSLDIRHSSDDPIYRFIYAFHMPLFMIISGLFFRSCLNYDFFPMLIRKVKQLLLPSYFWTLVVLLGYIVVWRVNPLEHRGGGFLLHHFWFLKCVFCCYLLGYIIRYISVNQLILVGGGILFLMFFFTGRFEDYHTVFLFPFFVVGHLLHPYLKSPKRHMRLLLLSGFSFAILYCFWSVEYTIYLSPIRFFSCHSLCFDYKNMAVMAYRFLIGLSGSLMVLLSIRLLYRENGLFRFMSCWGKETLGLYVLNEIIILFVLYPLHLTPHKLGFVWHALISLGYTVLTLALSMLIICGINRSKICTHWLLGKW